MCRTQSYTGGVFTDEDLEFFMDESVEESWRGEESDVDDETGKKSSINPCVASLDLGLSEGHQSVLCILEQRGEQWFVIRMIYIQDWLKARNMPYKANHYIREDAHHPPGIIDYAMDMVKGPYGDYNLISFVGDATGVGKSYIDYHLRARFRNKFGFDGVVPFIWASQSREFGGGKVPLLQTTVRPAITNGCVKSFDCQKLRNEMLSWEIIQRGNTYTGRASPSGIVQSDDGLTCMMQAIWKVLYNQGNPPGPPSRISPAPEIFGRRDAVHDRGRSLTAIHGGRRDRSARYTRGGRVPKRYR